MRNVEALFILIVTVIGCAAITHVLDVRIAHERALLNQASAGYERWRASPVGFDWEKAELEENRLRQAWWRLKETPMINRDMALILTTVESLGSNLLRFNFSGRWVKVLVSRDPKTTLERLRSLQVTSDWMQTGSNELSGAYAR